MRAHGRAIRIASAALTAVLCVAAVPTRGAMPPARQSRGVPTVSELLLDQLLGTASARASEYFALFKDLTASETKIVEQIQESGEVSRQRRIVSEFIVYTSQLDGGSIAEYRDVQEVDGSAVAGREQRVQALFAAKDHSSTVREELARVNKEGARYDLDYTVSGLTLAEGLPIQPWARALFDFTRVGDERVNARPVVVVAYAQAVADNRFGFKLSLPSEVRGSPPLYRGRLWLDAETAQLWREVRDVTVQTASGPVTVQRTEFEYGPSRFGIPLPTRIVFTSYGHFQVRDGRASSAPRYRLTFTYDTFRRFTTSSDEGEIARVAPPAADESDPLHPDADLGPEFGAGAPSPPDDSPTAADPAANQPPLRRNTSGRVRPPVAMPSAHFVSPGSDALWRPDQAQLPAWARAPQVAPFVIAPPPRPRGPGEPEFRPPPGG